MTNVMCLNQSSIEFISVRFMGNVSSICFKESSANKILLQLGHCIR